MIFDLHVHTTFSNCSDLRIEDILEVAFIKGLDGVCITDHDTMSAGKYLKEGVQENGLCVIFGMEYTTHDGDFLIFGPFEDLPKGMDARSLLTKVNQLNGVAIAAHPFRKERPVKEYVIQEHLCDAIEAINGRNTDIENLQVKNWCKKYSLNQVGGSDAHTHEELGSIITRFTQPITSRVDFIHAVKRGLCYPEWNIQDTVSRKQAALNK